MKKIIINIALLSISILANASIPQKNENLENNKSGLEINKTLQDEYAEDKYLREAYRKIPDMLDEGIESNKRSAKEGAALQVIMTSGISKTGFSKDDFSYLMNKESKVIKEYIKDSKIKGYLFIDHTLYFSKGYPDLPKAALEEFKKNAECQNGYCVYININNIKVLNEQLKEVRFDKNKFMTISEKYLDKSKLWEVKPNEITEPYKAISVKVISGYGLGGLDALDLAKKK